MTAVVKMEPVERWLDNNLARGMRGPFAIKGTLTPELAAALMERNDSNRKLSTRKISEYAADIEAGKWTLNGETVIVSDDGKLNNGQHRCAAVLEAEKSIETFFVFGIERPARLTVDQGVKRTVASLLQMSGHENSSILATAAAMCEQFERSGKMTREGRLRSTPAATREYIDEHPDLHRSVHFIAVNRPNIRMSYGVVAALHYIFAQIDRNESDEFILQLVSGVNLAKSDPVFVCRERIMSYARGRSQMNQGLLAEAVIRAWNARREGRELRGMRLTGDFPEIV